MTVDALNLALAAGLVLLVLRQVLPLAARLAGGFALSGFGSVESGAQRALGAARGVMAVASDALNEPEPTRPPVCGGEWVPPRGWPVRLSFRALILAALLSGASGCAATDRMPECRGPYTPINSPQQERAHG